MADITVALISKLRQRTGAGLGNCRKALIETEGDIEAAMDRLGDIVLARKETPASYHLAVTIDDHLQGITLVTRGDDLFSSTHVHRVLQALLGLDTPDYHHHRLLTGEDGRRFAKRDKSLTIRGLREGGNTPEQVRALAGFGDAS